MSPLYIKPFVSSSLHCVVNSVIYHPVLFSRFSNLSCNVFQTKKGKLLNPLVDGFSGRYNKFQITHLLPLLLQRFFYVLTLWVILLIISISGFICFNCPILTKYFNIYFILLTPEAACIFVL